MLSAGQLLAERYRLSSRIAVGGMGEVWRADDTRLDRTVAVKILKAELSGDAEFLHRFRTEARMTASLNHPNIAAVHDYGETAAPGMGEPADPTDPDKPADPNTQSANSSAHSIAYLVMELVEGEPLAAILVREGKLNVERTLVILEQAGHALQAAHERGLVHRDVKPGNILVVPGADGHSTVKLTDFGIAKAADAAPVTRSGMVMGTAHYIAPEQAVGHDAEPASDVYSLAVCGYECLTGYRPFRSENAVTVAMMHIRELPPPLPPDIPPNTRAIIEATLIKDPRQRYRDGGEFAKAVAVVRAGHPPPLPSQVAQPSLPPGLVQHPGHLPPAASAMPPTPMPVSPIASAAGFEAATPPTGLTMLNQHRARRNNTALWVTLALLMLILLAVVLFIVLNMADSTRTDDVEPPGDQGVINTSANWPSDEGPTRVTPELMPAEAAKETKLDPNIQLSESGQPSTQINGLQGMMSTLWTI